MGNNGNKKFVEDDEFSIGTTEKKTAATTKKTGYSKSASASKSGASAQKPANSKFSSSAKKKTPSKGKTGEGSVSAAVHKEVHAESKSKYSTHGNALFIVLLSIVFVAVVAFSSFLSYTYLVDRYENPILVSEIEIGELERIEFKVEKNTSTANIAKALKEQGLIKNVFLYKLMSKFNGYDSEYKSGVHYLREGLSMDEIMVILSDEPVTVKVTFPEGFTTLQIANRLEANDVCSAEEFLATINTLDYSSYEFMPKTKGNMDYITDGYLFPDTYYFEIHSSPETVIYKMLNRFNDIFLPEYYDRIEKMGLSVNDVVTIASYVEKEAKLNSERETIAGVYYNRLNSEDLKLMQCDYTVIYAKKRNGDDSTTITAEDLLLDDPYNTYLYEGLTPGAICSPSEASIKAVITMNAHEYYYYVLKNDGSGAHVFSKTLEEHKKAVEENRQDG